MEGFNSSVKGLMNSGLENDKKRSPTRVPSQPVHQRTEEEHVKYQQEHSALHPRFKPGTSKTRGTSITSSAKLLGAEY
jgi:hypothetical protein